ncbi:hypothetical protein [Pseudalkalibacillus berkeleyi]|uniref:Uncharacterized protein n=1 Tax=Pseudalkalibacillus berkeleyi TaxID=1069813 RepID=A0ABS9H4H2_9BACL|nr:hypothetical protein [Pseudalkalibacillus berkeleyi]MCF6138783.1 hypothetical protein [Pseudalkalibacillus berkeleyi]
MKKLVVANVLLLSSLLYVIFQVTKRSLYLNQISIHANNPVSLDWRYININTNIVQNSPESIYHISLLPVYALVFLSSMLIYLGLKGKHSK